MPSTACISFRLREERKTSHLFPLNSSVQRLVRIVINDEGIHLTVAEREKLPGEGSLQVPTAAQ